jgi:hypothetical protein
VSRSPRVALVALLAAVSALSACGPQRPTQVVKVTRYNDGTGVPLYVSSDATKLTGAPRDFQTFIQGRVRAAIEDDNGSCDEPPVYTVLTASTDFAAGDFSRCGIRHLVWAKSNGRWVQVLAYQADPQCADLKAHDVPPGITGDTCRDADGPRPYRG